MPSQTFTTTHRVAFHETDMAGAVHFSNFFRYAEHCEHALWAHLGVDLGGDLRERRSAWPRIKASCEYHRPAHFNDFLEVSLTLSRIGDTSLSYHFEVARDRQVLAAGEIVLVHATSGDAGFQATPIPPAIRHKLEALTATEENF
jgi:YbgC/YbaW family acyl-CoA thioester hydrolase